MRAKDAFEAQALSRQPGGFWLKGSANEKCWEEALKRLICKMDLSCIAVLPARFNQVLERRARWQIQSA